MKIKRIHVNQHNIKWNKKNPNDLPKPVISVKCGGKNYVGAEAIINGSSKVIYSTNKPLSCGARVWIETTAEVVIDDIILT